VMAGFGMLSYALIFIHALGIIVVPVAAAMPIIQTIAYLPSCITELVVGTWLLVKGLNMQHPDLGVSGSVSADRVEL